MQLKNSNVEWIGNIPDSWNVSRLQFCLKEINDKNEPIKTTRVLSLMKDVGVLPYKFNFFFCVQRKKRQKALKKRNLNHKFNKI